MCIICDGGSRYDIRSKVQNDIDQRGWSIVAVEDARQPWAYTVGLAELDQPELVVVGLPASQAGSTLNHLGEQLKGGVDLTLGVPQSCPLSSELTLVAVHPRQLKSGLMSAWFDHYSKSGSGPPPLRALQVCYPPCPCGQAHPPAVRLDVLTPVFDSPRPNRATRRAAQRRGGTRH